MIERFGFVSMSPENAVGMPTAHYLGRLTGAIIGGPAIAGVYQQRAHLKVESHQMQDARHRLVPAFADCLRLRQINNDRTQPEEPVVEYLGWRPPTNGLRDDA